MLIQIGKSWRPGLVQTELDFVGVGNEPKYDYVLFCRIMVNKTDFAYVIFF